MNFQPSFLSLILAGATGIALSAQSGDPRPVGGGAIGIDNSPKSYDELKTLFTSGVTTNVTNMQTSLLMTGTPSATGSVDPYKRDANGNIIYDASGNPIRKTQAEIDAEIQAGMNNATGGSTSAPTNGMVDVNPADFVRPPEITPPPPPTSVGDYGVQSPVNPPVEGQDWNIDGNPWNRDRTEGLGVGNGTVSIDPGVTTGLLDGIGSVVTGGTPIPTDIGNPGDPIVLTIPKVCKCCGAPVSAQPQPTWIWLTGDIFYLVAEGDSVRTRSMRCQDGSYSTYETRSHLVMAEPLGGVVEGPQCQSVYTEFHQGGEAVFDDCFGAYVLPEPYESTRFLGFPVDWSEGPEVPADLLQRMTEFSGGFGTWESHGVFKGKISCPHQVPGTPIMKDRCDNGHWQDEPCPNP